MDKLSSLYNSQAKCPVCEADIEITKVKSKSVRLLRQDSDFCPYYENENPIYYEAVICPECGYGSHITTFENINRYDKAKVRDKITSKWIKRSFLGERTSEKALEAFKLVLLNLYEREAPKSEMAKICMRIAWLYRYSGDKNLERRFMEHALTNYKIAYHDEDLNSGKLDEYMCMFIVGELCKRTEQYDESIKWFSRLIMSYSDPNQKGLISNKLVETARDIIQEAKNLAAKNKEA